MEDFMEQVITNVRALMEIKIDDWDYPSQPRTVQVTEKIKAMSRSIEAGGQHSPVLCFRKGGRYSGIDGGCRVAALKLLGRTTVWAMVLPHEPTVSEIALAQLAIDLQREELPAIDRARLLKKTRESTGWTNKAIADSVGISAGQVTRSLQLLDLHEDVQAMVSDGRLEWSKASLIAEETKDPVKQHELAQTAKSMTRAALRIRIKGKPTPKCRVSRLRFHLAGGMSVVVAGKSLTWDDVLGAIADLSKAAKKSSDEGLTLRSFVQVCADRAKSGVA
jgi:ParB/RepB/Spo0J family partition protein